MYSLGYVLGPLGLGLGLETWGRVIIKCPRTRVRSRVPKLRVKKAARSPHRALAG